MPQPLAQQIFLIDNDEVVRDSLKVLLESHGLQVRDFRNAAEFLGTADFSLGGCLVLGHNRMIADGLELMRALTRRNVGLPVIFIVGGGNPASKAAATAAGAFAYLQRPTDETSLICTLKAALARKGECDTPLAADQSLKRAAPRC